MKKFLAVLLALITILTLAACKKTPSTPVGGGDDDDDDGPGFVINTETEAVTDNETDKETDKETEIVEWETVSYKIYAMADVNVRADASTKAEKLSTAVIGQEFDAVAKNGSWYKVKNGDGFAYITAEYVTADKDESTFIDDAEPSALKIVENEINPEDPYKVNLRKFPVVAETTLGTTVSFDDTQAGELQKIGQNTKGNWFKVTYEGSTYYIKMNNTIREYFGLATQGGEALG